MVVFMGWNVGSPSGGTTSEGTPTVSVTRAVIRIREIHFATDRTGNNNYHFLYFNLNNHPQMPGRNFHWWGKGAKITVPEWTSAGRNLRACFTRNAPIAMSVKLVANTTTDLTGTISMTPTLDGSTDYIQPVTVEFTFPANATEHWVNLTPEGNMPDEVGRYILRMNWNITGAGLIYRGLRRTQHRIYSIYGQPLQPEYDSPDPDDTGQNTSDDDGTFSGTRKRLDHMTLLIGGRLRRKSIATHDDLEDLAWELHKGINDTPNAPPYFNANNDISITIDPFAEGPRLTLDNQWLSWAPSRVHSRRVENPSPPPRYKTERSHWNDMSCIGHVQLAKTMLATTGIFARRIWVLPHTTQIPDGSGGHQPVDPPFSDTDYYCLGEYDENKEQIVALEYNGDEYPAIPRLMEPDINWECFEACLLSPTNKFLPGGYSTTRRDLADFRTNKGFDTAAELLHWWCNTSRRGFGRRFLCWVYWNREHRECHFWDIDGVHYEIRDYLQIRDNGKDLPPP